MLDTDTKEMVIFNNIDRSNAIKTWKCPECGKIFHAKNIDVLIEWAEEHLLTEHKDVYARFLEDDPEPWGDFD